MKGQTMKLFLHETPNDKRTWRILPTHNKVSTLPSDHSIQIDEDPQGDIFIERYVGVFDSKKFYFFVRVSSENNKSNHSDWIKRFSINEN
jgi:hypothetical protein